VTQFTDDQMQQILDIVSPLMERALAGAVAESIVSTPVPVLRPGTVRSIDTVHRSCTVLIDGDNEQRPNNDPISCLMLGELPILNGRVLVVFSPPSAVYAISMSPAVPAGCIMAFGGTITSDVINADPTTQQLPPFGWLWCYGQLVNVADYSALYDAIGTSYNTGGETAGLTFRVPDLRAHILIGMDNMGGTDRGVLGTANTLGQTLGVDLAVANDVGYTIHYIIKY